MRNFMLRDVMLIAVSAVVMLTVNSALAAPIVGQINPIAVYKDTPGAFGLTYDSMNDVMWYDALSGPTAISLKPFKNYEPDEIAVMPIINGLPVVDNLTAEHRSLTTPLPSGGEALAYNAMTNKLVMNRASLGSTSGFDPITGANVAVYGFGERILTDGLDIGPTGTLWHSRDGFTGLIHKDGVVFASENLAQTDLTLWSVLGIPSVTDFWSGVQQIGDSLFAVAVQTNDDIANSRTIVRFDINTGELLAYDPDGYEHARRWEDLGFDGRYLYAADLRGNEFGGTSGGQVFVFDLGGGLDPTPPPTTVPEPSTWLLMATGLLGLLGYGWRRKPVA